MFSERLFVTVTARDDQIQSGGTMAVHALRGDICKAKQSTRTAIPNYSNSRRPSLAREPFADVRQTDLEETADTPPGSDGDLNW